jgi:hypothetical protein
MAVFKKLFQMLLRVFIIEWIGRINDLDAAYLFVTIPKSFLGIVTVGIYDLLKFGSTTKG